MILNKCLRIIFIISSTGGLGFFGGGLGMHSDTCSICLVDRLHKDCEKALVHLGRTASQLLMNFQKHFFLEEGMKAFASIPAFRSALGDEI